MFLFFSFFFEGRFAVQFGFLLAFAEDIPDDVVARFAIFNIIINLTIKYHNKSYSKIS